MNRAITYAEDQLGVHRTWIDLQELNTQLNDLYQMRSNFEIETRRLDWQLDVRKNEILVSASEDSKDMNVTAFERHVKLLTAKDEHLLSINQSRVDAMSRRDSVEATIRSAEQNHKAHIARLNELGGYFNYLGVAKAAQLQSAMAVQEANGSPW